jgi:hypothetical protein
MHPDAAFQSRSRSAELHGRIRLALILLTLSLLGVSEVSTAPPARAVSTTAPFNIVTPVRGYQGEGFFFTENVRNNGSTDLRVSSVLLSLDYGTFRVGNPGNIPSQASGESFWISIPRTEPIGNHTFTVTASFESYDNHTRTWTPLSDSPRVLTGTLTVFPEPTTTAFNSLVVWTTLPIFAILLVSGVFIGLFPFKRRPGPKPPADLPTSETDRRLSFRIPALIVAGCSSITAIIIWYASTISLYNYATLAWSQAFGLVELLLAMTVTAAVFKHVYTPRSLVSILLLSLSATFGSTIVMRTIWVAGPCRPGLLGAGFPFPWASVWYPYLGQGLISCPLYVLTPLIVSPVGFFLIDTVFYSAIMLAILGLYRAFQKKTPLAVTSCLPLRRREL